MKTKPKWEGKCLGFDDLLLVGAFWIEKWCNHWLMKPSKNWFECTDVLLRHVLADWQHICSELFTFCFGFVFILFSSFSARKRYRAPWEWGFSSGHCRGSRFRCDNLLCSWRRTADKTDDLWTRSIPTNTSEQSEQCNQSAKCQCFRYQWDKCSVQSVWGWDGWNCLVCGMYV